MSDQELSANDSEVNTSLTKVLEAVEEGRHQTSKRYGQLIKSLDALSDNISDLDNRMDAVDQFLRNPLAALFPTNTQLRIGTHTQAHGTTSLSFTLVQPQAQTQPVQNQALPPAAASQNAPNNNAITQAPAPPQPNPSTNAAAPPVVQPRAKPGSIWKNTITKRALPPSPPKITSKNTKTTRPRKPAANEPVAARRKRKDAGATEAGENEVRAGARNQNDEDQHIPRHLRKDDTSEAPSQTAAPSNKRKVAAPTASVSSETDEEEEEEEEEQPQPPRKKGKNKK